VVTLGGGVSLASCLEKKRSLRTGGFLSDTCGGVRDAE